MLWFYLRTSSVKIERKGKGKGGEGREGQKERDGKREGRKEEETRGKLSSKWYVSCIKKKMVLGLGCSSVVQHLPILCKAWTLILSIAYKTDKQTN